MAGKICHLVRHRNLFIQNVWFQKISRPPPRRELEIPGGWGGQRPRKFQEEGGVGP